MRVIATIAPYIANTIRTILAFCRIDELKLLIDQIFKC